MKLSAVTGDIEAALVRRAKSDAKKIHVELNGSTVTLTGSVNNWAERDTARDTAWGTPGVVNVIDKITMDF
jgi:osmotically-inducible protein OsmY